MVKKENVTDEIKRKDQNKKYLLFLEEINGEITINTL